MKKDLMKKEALRRLKALRVLPNVIEEFEKEGVIYYSERFNSFSDGILYWLSNDKDWEAQIKGFEKKYNAVVYHCQLSHTSFGRLLSVLFVSDKRDYWPDEFTKSEEPEKNGTSNYYIYAYVINLDDPLCTEFGEILIAPKNGGITRLA